MRQLTSFFFIFLIFISNVTFSEMYSIEKMLSLAKQGVVRQQYNIAYSFYYGNGVELNKAKALHWFDIAAKGDDAAVHYKIGRLYEKGEIYSQNNNKAFQHYLLSANGGDLLGASNLSAMYLQGKGINKDINEGIRWAEKPAKQGFVNAQVNLALAYSIKGSSIYNADKAIYWFRKAAVLGSTLAQSEMGKYHFRRKDYEKAFEYFDLAVEGGDTNAMIMLAVMFEKGLATQQNSEKSLKLLQLAHKQGNQKAGHYLKLLEKNQHKSN